MKVKKILFRLSSLFLTFTMCLSIASTTSFADTSAALIPRSTFVDVLPGQWHYEAIEYVVSKGYFTGVGSDRFAPGDMMTRAMFVTVLGRIAGIEETFEADTVFSDVEPGHWYSTYVAWAANAGIVQGLGDGTFSPDSSITREQMAVFLYRFAKYAGMNMNPGGNATTSSLSDLENVSSWAREAMSWAVRNGLMQGTAHGIEPKALATRAQVAQIIFNFCRFAEN